jgi:hypothetical protein
MAMLEELIAQMQKLMTQGGGEEEMDVGEAVADAEEAMEPAAEIAEGMGEMDEEDQGMASKYMKNKMNGGKPKKTIGIMMTAKKSMPPQVSALKKKYG